MAEQPTPPRAEHRELPEDEIDLADLVAVLIRRWRWIVAITAGVLLLAVAFSLWKGSQQEAPQPQWQFSVLAELPYVPARYTDSQEGPATAFVPIEPAGMALHRIRAIADAEGSDSPELWRELEFSLPGKEDGGLLRIQATLPERQTVKPALESLLDRLDQEYAARLSEQSDSLQSVRMVADPAWSNQTPSVSKKDPNHRLHAALGLVLGLFLGVFVAFLVEFWANNRARILAEADRDTGTE